MHVRLDKQKPLVTLEEFLSTYEDKDHPRAASAVEFLESRKLLPLAYNSPLFPDLNILISLALWSGSLLLDSANRPRVNLHLDELVRMSIEDALTDLKVDLTGTNNYYSLGNNGSAYSRLISQIRGMPLSQGNRNQVDRKAGKEVTLPEYINFLVEKYSKLHNNDRDIARKILADHTNVLLQTRLRYGSPFHFQVQLFECPSKDSTDELARQVLRLISTVYPRIGLSPSSVARWTKAGKKYTRYQPVITLNKQSIINAVQYYHMFRLELTRHFQPYGKRITNE